MNIMLTGASGLLGSALRAEADARGWTCTALSHSSVWDTPLDALVERLRESDVLVHAAANTNVEQCEKDPDACYKDNFLLTERLAEAATRAEIRMVYISSTGIYGTAKQDPYKEYDAVKPTTHHHASKYMGEEAVQRLGAFNLVIRTGWLFGGPYDAPKNFVARRIDEAMKAAQDRKSIHSNNEQRGVPCYNVDIARRILELIELKSSGVFNCVNEGNASRFEYVSKIIELNGLAVAIEPSSASSFKRAAQVSNNEMAENWRMAAMGLSAMPHWSDGLKRYLTGFEKTEQR